MNKKSRQVILLGVLVFILIVVNYPLLNKGLINFLDESETGVVERVIDGDTIVINGTSVRMLGINTPERGKKYYNEAKEFLETLVLNRTVKLEYGKDKFDKYGRKLAYVFVNSLNVNLELVKKGYANPYFVSGKDKYYQTFYSAWENCDINLCEKSISLCRSCVIIDIGENITLKNICTYKCNINNWTIKNEGRKERTFNQTIYPDEKINFELIVTPKKDTLYLRDDGGRIVLEKSLWD